MKNNIVTLSKSLKKLGLKKESLEIISILKKSQNLDTINQEYPKDPERYNILIRDLSAYLKDTGGLLSNNLMSLVSSLFSKKKSPGRIISDINLLLFSLDQWYGSEDPEYPEPIQKRFRATVKDIKDGLELLKNNADMSESNVSMRLKLNESIYDGQLLENIPKIVGGLMVDLSRKIL